MYWSSPFRRTLNTGYVTGLDMCKVCTEAVHSVALSTRVTLGLGMCKVCTEAVHSVALWTRVTVGLGMCKVCTEAAHSLALWTRVTWQVWTCVHYVPNHRKRTKVHENIRPDINAPPETTIDFMGILMGYGYGNGGLCCWESPKLHYCWWLKFQGQPPFGWAWNPINKGTNYQPQLVQDFWTINNRTPKKKKLKNKWNAPSIHHFKQPSEPWAKKNTWKTGFSGPNKLGKRKKNGSPNKVSTWSKLDRHPRCQPKFFLYCCGKK